MSQLPTRPLHAYAPFSRVSHSIVSSVVNSWLRITCVYTNILRRKRLKTFQYFHSQAMFGCLKHSPTLVPFHYTRLRRVHAEKLPCYWFSSLLHEHFDPHTRVPRKGDGIKSNVSCLDWVIQCMFTMVFKSEFASKICNEKKEKSLNHQLKFTLR